MNDLEHYRNAIYWNFFELINIRWNELSRDEINCWSSPSIGFKE